MQDADEPVGEGSEGLVVEIAGGAVLVVELSAAWALGEGAERGLVEGVVESPVPDVAGQNGFLLSGRDRAW